MFNITKSFWRYFHAYRNYATDSNIISSILTKNPNGKEITVQGWIKSLRKQKEIIFMDIGDGTASRNLQIVVPRQMASDSTKLSVGTSIKATGILRKTPKGQNELACETISVYGECDLEQGYPFAPRKQYAPDYIREYLHLRSKTKKFASLLRLRHAVVMNLHKYLDDNNYINIHTPVITSNDCEGAGELFKVLPDNVDLLKSMKKENVQLDDAFFDGKAYLTVSGQLHLEAAVHALRKVYCLGPTFRAENSRTRFHLSEFYMLELEEAFIENLEDLLIIVEKLIKIVTQTLVDHHSDDIDICTEGKHDYSWLQKQFIIITLSEAVDILTNKLKKHLNHQGSLSKEHELILTEYFKNVPVFIINWPAEEKPFYMKTIENTQNVAAFDLLAPNIGEIAGGSLRENSYEKLKSRIPRSNGNESHLNWYLDLRKFGGVPTGGFGLGFERYLQFLLGIDSIKDCIPFPRWPHNCNL